MVVHIQPFSQLFDKFRLLLIYKNKDAHLMRHPYYIYLGEFYLDLAFQPGVAGYAVDGHKGKNKWCALDIGLKFGDRAIHFGLS